MSEKSFKSRKRLLVLIAILFTIVCGQLVFKIFIAPKIVLKKIVFKSEVSLSDEALLSLAGINKGAYYYSINPVDIKARLEETPEVRKAVVVKNFPDKMSLFIYGRKPVALALLKVNERTYPVAIDRSGVVYGGGTDLEQWDLPVVSGIQFDTYRAGMRLPVPLKPLFEDLASLKGENLPLYSLISEIRIERRGESGYDLILFLDTYPLRGRISDKLDVHVLKNMIMVFDVIKQQKLTEKIEEVDFRTKEITYRLREEV